MQNHERPHLRNKRILLLPTLPALLLLCGFNWGFFAHKEINRAAVFTLPAEMLRFYKSNLDYISQQAVAADKRRYVVEEEAARHYLDMESYGEGIFHNPPRSWKKAAEKFGKDTLLEHGILPWHILLMTERLTKAFLNRDSVRILRYSADLGHYLADAHVPLHTTRNYNGQLTGQTGIHAFWETRIPELFSGEYDYFVGKAQYIGDLPGATWAIIFESHRAADSVLSLEASLDEKFPSDRKYTVYLKNNRPVRNYSESYARAYRGRLSGMVERRMTKAILSIGNFWYTAWVNAGQPDLNHLHYKPLTNAELSLQEKENKDHKGAKMLGREE